MRKEPYAYQLFPVLLIATLWKKSMVAYLAKYLTDLRASDEIAL